MHTMPRTLGVPYWTHQHATAASDISSYARFCWSGDNVGFKIANHLQVFSPIGSSMQAFGGWHGANRLKVQHELDAGHTEPWEPPGDTCSTKVHTRKGTALVPQSHRKSFVIKEMDLVK